MMLMLMMPMMMAAASDWTPPVRLESQGSRSRRRLISQLACARYLKPLWWATVAKHTFVVKC